MSKPARLDAEVVRRGLAPTLAEAQAAIGAGKVIVKGMPVTRPSARVTPESPVELIRSPAPFVSRGGDKLDGALARLDVEVAGRRWLDAGASTGGFTDRLLQGGAAAVAAVDVGYGDLAWKLRSDARVVVIERTNVRRLDSAMLPWPPDGVVADLSFISLTIVLPTLVRVARPGADFVLLVKPQFEVRRGAVGPGGVVRDPTLWKAALVSVVEAGAKAGLGLGGATLSAPPGPAGNREFFLHLRAGQSGGESIIDRAVGDAE